MTEPAVAAAAPGTGRHRSRPRSRSRLLVALAVLGPGLLAGLSDDDPAFAGIAASVVLLVV